LVVQIFDYWSGGVADAVFEAEGRDVFVVNGDAEHGKVGVEGVDAEPFRLTGSDGDTVAFGKA
jgi:hypothetical protein